MLLSEGSLFADNGKYGIEIPRVGENSVGSVSFTNDTTVYNAPGGEEYFDLALGAVDPVASFTSVIGLHVNSIMHANNPFPGNGDQVIGLDAALLTTLQDGDFACSGTPVPFVDMGYDEVLQPECVL